MPAAVSDAITLTVHLPYGVRGPAPASRLAAPIILWTSEAAATSSKDQATTARAARIAGAQQPPVCARVRRLVPPSTWARLPHPWASLEWIR